MQGPFPLIKKIVRAITIEEARADFENVMALNTAKEVRAYVLERTKQFPGTGGKGYLDESTGTAAIERSSMDSARMDSRKGGDLFMMSIKIVCRNKKAGHEYFIDEVMRPGLFFWAEVKSSGKDGPTWWTAMPG